MKGGPLMSIDRRSLILKAAAQSFAQFGYKATTMDLVSKIANVGKGTIYTFYSTKEELFAEILHKALDEMNQILAQSIQQSDSFLENLFRLLDDMLEFRSDHELFIKLAQEFRDIGTTQAMEGILKMEGLVKEALKQEIERAIQHKEVAPCDTEIVAFMILRLYFALTTDWSKFNKPLDKEQIKVNMRLLIAEGIMI
jgi:TetR/AcrR family transcriptional regulator of autoinduction and epiphytic fitness